MKAHIGNLYEINKAAYAKEPLMTKEKIEEKQDEIFSYFYNHSNTYFMLLCNEQKDYTVIKLNNLKDNKSAANASAALIECLSNRGNIIDIERQDNGAYECWIKRSGIAYMYALFPYDAAIIEC